MHLRLLIPDTPAKPFHPLTPPRVRKKVIELIIDIRGWLEVIASQTWEKNVEQGDLESVQVELRAVEMRGRLLAGEVEPRDQFLDAWSSAGTAAGSHW